MEHVLVWDAFKIRKDFILTISRISKFVVIFMEIISLIFVFKIPSNQMFCFPILFFLKASVRYMFCASYGEYSKVINCLSLFYLPLSLFESNNTEKGYF